MIKALRTMHGVAHHSDFLSYTQDEQYVKIENITKSYNGRIILDNISLTIKRNEFFALLGASGCGKTTLLRILAGFDTPTSGTITVDGIDVTDTNPRDRGIGLMFQSYALFPNMTIRENVMFGLKQDKLQKNVMNRMTDDVLELVELTEIANKMPHQISGGQKQRTALARSIVKRPKLLLLDEPMSALDKYLREKTQFELCNIQEKINIPFVIVTHDQGEAMAMADRMGIMHNGCITQIGKPHEIYEFPNSKYVASFIGDINFFDGIVTEIGNDYSIVESDDIECNFYITNTGTIPVDSRVTVAIRPEKIMISNSKPTYPRNWTSGIVKEIGYCGGISVYHIVLQSGKTIKVVLPNLVRMSERNITWDDVVYILWRAENCIILPS